MATEAELSRIEGKVDDVARDVGQMSTTITTFVTRLENYPSIVEQVADHENRITTVEAMQVQQLSERVQKLEGQHSKVMGWVAGATAVAAAVGGLLTWFISQLSAASV